MGGGLTPIYNAAHRGRPTNPCPSLIHPSNRETPLLFLTESPQTAPEQGASPAIWVANLRPNPPIRMRKWRSDKRLLSLVVLGATRPLENPSLASSFHRAELRTAWIGSGTMFSASGGSVGLHIGRDSANQPANRAPTHNVLSSYTLFITSSAVPTGVPSTLMPSQLQTCSPKSSTLGGDCWLRPTSKARSSETIFAVVPPAHWVDRNLELLGFSHADIFHF